MCYCRLKVSLIEFGPRSSAYFLGEVSFRDVQWLFCPGQSGKVTPPLGSQRWIKICWTIITMLPRGELSSRWSRGVKNKLTDRVLENNNSLTEVMKAAAGKSPHQPGGSLVRHPKLSPQTRAPSLIHLSLEKPLLAPQALGLTRKPRGYTRLTPRSNPESTDLFNGWSHV